MTRERFLAAALVQWGRGGTNTLAVNSGINAGLEMFVRSATNARVEHSLRLEPDFVVRTLTKTYADTERALFAAAGAGVEPKFVEAEHAVEGLEKRWRTRSRKRRSRHYFLTV